jgi:hypothetical protein
MGVKVTAIIGVMSAILLAVGGASATTAVRSCGSITIQEPTGTGGHKPFPLTDITATGVTCSYAKSFVKERNSGYHPAPKGWKYSYKVVKHGRYPIHVTWTKGHDVITYRYSCSGC